MSAAPKVSRRLLCALPCVGALLLASSAHAGRNKNEVRSIDHQEVSDATQILIRGTSTPTFTVYKLDRPARVVVDVSNATMSRKLDRSGGEKSTWQVNTWAVGQVSAHAIGSARGSVVRVVVGLARPGGYKVKAVGHDVRVTIAPRDAPPAASGGGEPTAASDAKRKAVEAQAEAARARAEASSAQRKAAAAEAELKEVKRTLAAAKAEAQRVVTTARADAARAKREAEKRSRESARQLAEANEKMKAADAQISQARMHERNAAKAKREALAAERNAVKRERASTDAAKRAAARQAEAERAAAAAKRYKEEAAGVVGDGKRLAALRQRAERAAAEADERRVKAEAAAKMADKRRSEAENAASAAEARRKQALAATKSAERERGEAESRRANAVRTRQQAETRQEEAVRRSAEAQKAAKQAIALAERAKQLRVKEEAAYRSATVARQQAEARQRDISSATAELEARMVAARRAEETAKKSRERAEAARRDADAKRGNAAGAQALAKARAEVRRLEAARADAEADVAARRRDVKDQKKTVARLRSEVDGAAAELGQLKLAARKARAAREKEEQQLQALAHQRAAAERELERARTAREEAERAVARAEKATSRVAKQHKAATKKSSRVRRVEFVDRNKVARVSLALSSPARPRVVTSSGKKAVLEIDGATIAEDLERTLDTTRYRGPIQAISSYRDPKNPSKVRVEVQLSRPTKSRLEKVGNIYHWDFDKPTRVASASGKGKRSGKKSKTRKASKSARYPTPVAGGYASSSTPITQQTVAQAARSRAKVYRGTKIDLDFKDADIHNLLRLLADVGGVNIVIPDEIKYRVTVRMRRVPWDQALEVILASKGLWYERNGNLYRIAPRKELDAEAQAEAERRAAMVKAEVPGTDYVTLNYAEAGSVQSQLGPMLSPKGQLQVDKRTNTIVVIDVKANRNNILELLRRLDTPTPQIQIEARVVEARSSFQREFGIQWGGSAVASGPTGNSTGLVFPNSVALGGGADDSQASSNGVAASPTDFAVNMPAAVGGGSGGALGLALGSVGGNFALNLRLSALENDGTVRIVSAPKITVLNNIAATISQGVSIPVSVVSANGVQTQFVPADLSLKVTPTVSQADCAVTLDLAITKNEADFANTGARGDPSILRKEAKTTVLVADGATTVLGGIYTRNTGLSYSKVPFFGDLPVLGWFFKKRSENDDRTEVLVFITPKITNRAHLRCERPVAPR